MKNRKLINKIHLTLNNNKQLIVYLLVSSFILLGAIKTTHTITAQDSNLFLSIININHQNYPQVTAYVAATDNNNQPVTNLNSSNFKILENNVAISSTLITVQEVTTAPLDLVLIIDTSMPTNLLNPMKKTVTDFIDTLTIQPNDQIAIIELYDKLDLDALPFTNNANTIKQTINALETNGNYTAMNEAIYQAVAMHNNNSNNRKAVLLFSNMRTDNIRSRTLTSTLKFIETHNIPIYPFSFNPVNNKTDLEQIARASGGQAYLINQPTQIPNYLTPLSAVLRHGYKLSFQSPLLADGSPHTLDISVSNQNQTAQSQQQFTPTTSNVLTITPLNLVAGQTVWGIINLESGVSGPYPIKNVQYTLNNNLLGEVSTAPYQLPWDTSSTPSGNYTLTFKAIDQANNQASVAYQINVIPPIEITLSTDDPTPIIGDKVVVVAQVNALEDIVSTQFFIDDTPVVSNTASSQYTLVFNSSPYQTGTHTISIKVTDKKGHTATEAIDIILSTPETQAKTPSLLERLKEMGQNLKSTLLNFLQTWQDYIISLLGCLIFLLLIAALLFWQSKQNQADFLLDLNNEGNIESRYVLSGVDDSGLLAFEFTLDRKKLLAQPTNNNAKQGIWFETDFIDPGQILNIDLRIKRGGIFHRKKSYPFKILSKSIEANTQDTIVASDTFELKGIAWFTWLIGIVLGLILAISCPSILIFIINRL